jgi:hypothetical protein
VDTLKEVEVVDGRVSIVGMRNASERLYDEFCGYITEKKPGRTASQTPPRQ